MRDRLFYNLRRHNLFYGLVYIMVCFIALILIFQLIQVRKSELGVYLILITSLIVFWLLVEGLSFYVNNKEIILFFQRIKYVSIVTVTPLMFIMSIVLTFGRKSLQWRKSIFLFVIPLCSLMSALTNYFPYTFINNPKIIYQGQLLIYSYDRDIGFFIHMIYSYSMLLLGNVVLVYRLIKSPKLYKNQSVIIAAGSILAFLFNILFITNIIGDIEFDTTPISILVAIFVYYWALYILPVNKLQIEARSLMVENITDLMIILDIEGNIVDVNGAALTFFTKVYNYKNTRPITPSDYLNVSLEKVLALLEIDSDPKVILQGEDKKSVQFEILGETYYYHLQRRDILDDTNSSIGELILLHDITATQIYLKQLIDKNNELIISDAVIENARESIIIIDKDNKIVKVNPSMLKMSGYKRDEVVGNHYSMLRSDQHDIVFYETIWDSVSSRGYWEGELSERKKNGEIYLTWMSYTTIRDEDGKVSYYVIMASDISRLKKAEDDLIHMAYYDSLTNLPNRLLFRKQLKAALLKVKKTRTEIALLYIDIDKFKNFNDSLGHWAGDQLLISIAQRVRESLKEGDMISRMDGDEFTIILEEIESAVEVEKIAKNIIESFEEPLFIKDLEINVVVSIGIALTSLNDLSEESLVRKADIAMYQAKKSKMSDYCFISEELEKRELLRNEMTMVMKKAYNSNEFHLYLQPQVRLVDKKVQVVGAEALLRWTNSIGEKISPVDFIPVAEENGMIHVIGLWVFEEIFRMNTLLRQRGMILDLSINVSILQFVGKGFMEKIAKMLDTYSDPINLTIEITESLFFDNLEKGIENLMQLKAFGFKIAMDDFGTGFSSMSYMKRLPLDYVKIDKSFVDDIEISSGKNLADMVLTMAKLLDLKTVGEGVETEIQARYLTESGCDVLQGYLYSKPLEFNDFVAYVDKYKSSKVSEDKGWKSDEIKSE